MRIPKLHLHVTGQYMVKMGGKSIYLGNDSSIAERKYREIIAEHYGVNYGVKFGENGITVAELLDRYTAEILSNSAPQWRKVKQASLDQMKAKAIELYGGLSACDFGPKSYKSVRIAMANGQQTAKDSHDALNENCRSKNKSYFCKTESVIVRRNVTKRSVSYMNGLMSKLKAAFKWGVSEELVPVETYQRLKTVPDLKPGELGLTNGREVKPVSESLYKATLPFLSETMSDLLTLLWLSGARPGEILALTPNELTKDGDYYIYRPAGHKTARHNKLRAIVFGKEATAILKRYWPAEPGKRFFPHYSRSEVIRTAISRACKRANLPKWHPYQLRHAAITRISLQHGKDVAQAVGGHSKMSTTEHYDAGNIERAKRAAG